MKISKRDIGIIVTVLGLVVLIMVYNFVFVSFRDKTDAVNAEISQLSETEYNLEQLEANMAYYQSEITRLEESNSEIVSHFPANILPENEIMYTVELEDNNDIYFTSLNYGTSVIIAGGTVTQEVSTTDPDTGETITTTTEVASASSVEADELVMDMTFESTYDGLKSTILYNKDQNNRMVIDGITAAYDDTTGQLTGTMTLNQYYIVGTENVYQEPYIPSLRTGLDNIFGTNGN